MDNILDSASAMEVAFLDVWAFRPLILLGRDSRVEQSRGVKAGRWGGEVRIDVYAEQPGRSVGSTKPGLQSGDEGMGVL